MNRTNRSRCQDVQQALKHLRIQIAGNLQAFNDAAPHASWLRRSEIERFSADLLHAAEWAPQRRPPLWQNQERFCLGSPKFGVATREAERAATITVDIVDGCHANGNEKS